MAPATSSNGSLILEEPLIRVSHPTRTRVHADEKTPFELLRRSHRSAQRQVEKDFTSVQSALSSILKSLPSTPTADDRESLASKLDAAGERVRGLKRKLDDLQPNAENPTSLRYRLTYLDALNKVAKPITEVVTTKIEKKEEPTTDEKKEGEGQKVATGEEAEMGLEPAASSEATVAAPQVEAVSSTNGAGADMAIDEEPSAGPSGSATPPNEDNDKTLDRYIVDYLLRTRRMNAAKALAEKQEIEQLVDLKLFSELQRIQKALVESRSVTEALAWCGENRGTLKKTKNNLEFTLRLQDFIELCRKRDTPAAIAYSRKHLSPWAASHMSEIQKAMALLTFGETTGVASYRKLYDRERWHTVWLQFKKTFLSLYALPSQPLLSLALSAGLSSLRLPSCVPYEDPSAITPKSPVIPLLPAAPPLHTLDAVLTSPILSHASLASDSPDESIKKEDPAVGSGNVDCPTCHPDMKILAREVPMSHHVNSTIVCRISGEVMDSQNEPLAFPNGYVYSSKALAEMAKNNFDVVTCPRTRESCAFSRLRKVYIS